MSWIRRGRKKEEEDQEDWMKEELDQGDNLPGVRKV